MARNPDGSVVLATTGKVATPGGSNRAPRNIAPLARSAGVSGAKVVGLGGRVGPAGKGSISGNVR